MDLTDREPTLTESVHFYRFEIKANFKKTILTTYVILIAIIHMKKITHLHHFTLLRNITVTASKLQPNEHVGYFTCQLPQHWY